jgi:serine/threonine protein kinase
MDKDISFIRNIDSSSSHSITPKKKKKKIMTKPFIGIEEEILKSPILRNSPYHPLLYDSYYKREGDCMFAIYEMEPLEFYHQFTERISSQGRDEDDDEWAAHSVAFMIDSLCALHNIHSSGYCHGDISPGNIGFSAMDDVLKIIDFGQSFRLTNNEDLESNRRPGGTKGYRDPLLYDEEGGCGIFSKDGDLYSLMKTFYSIFIVRKAGDFLWADRGDYVYGKQDLLIKVYKSVVNSNLKERPSIPDCLRSLIDHLMLNESSSIDRFSDLYYNSIKKAKRLLSFL